MKQTEQNGSTTVEPVADLHAPSPIEKRISYAFLTIGLAIIAAAVILGGRAFWHSSPPAKTVAPVAIQKPSLPAQKPEPSIAKETIIVPLLRPVDHPLANEAGKASIDPAVRDLLDRGWALVAPPYSLIRWQQAGQDFEQALRVDPESNEARIGLAHILGAKMSDQWSPVLQENPKRAEELLKELLNKGDTTMRMAAAHYELGLVYQIQNRLAEAKAEFMRSIALEPDNPRAHLHLGETLMYLGNPDCHPFEKAIRLTKQEDDITAMNYWALGTCHLLLGDADQGIVGLDKALAANDRFWVPYFYLAGAYGLKDDLDEAKSALSESLKWKPAVRSLARMRSENPWLSNQHYWDLQEDTLNRGLRQAGLPDH
ncbi:MAG: tetratricopeptide repeat protein [Acidobacteria bacterium]|nr:tetratricopeptide repeat protein [Acidobacteriota bacterium]